MSTKSWNDWIHTHTQQEAFGYQTHQKRLFINFLIKTQYNFYQNVNSTNYCVIHNKIHYFNLYNKYRLLKFKSFTIILAVQLSLKTFFSSVVRQFYK